MSIFIKFLAIIYVGYIDSYDKVKKNFIYRLFHLPQIFKNNKSGLKYGKSTRYKILQIGTRNSKYD